MHVEIFGRSVGIVILFSPLICALIGWLTNYLAVRMLFQPRKPVRLGFLTLHGVFPKRQKALAEGLGHMVEKNLINHDDLQKVLHDPSFLSVFRNTAARHVESFLNEKLGNLNPMIQMFLTQDMKNRLRDMLLDEMDNMLPDLMEGAASELENRLVFRDIVREKVEGFPSEKVEKILLGIMAKEFRFIEVVGGVLGFLVGLVQLGLFVFVA